MNTILYPLFIYLAIGVLYYLVFALASIFRNKKKYSQPNYGLNKIAVFIPAYKEDAIIVDTAQKALEQNYPTNLFTVYIIADSMQPATIVNLQKLPLEVVEVCFEKSTKTRAINETYRRIATDYDISVVLDADNIMEPDFLSKINDAYNSGATVMQAHRVAKNQQNELATLDAISEEINNNIFRKGHVNLGLSSALIGSGMAFDFHVFKDEMSKIDAIGGFDKELELALLKKKQKIVYLQDALVYDEKVSESKTFGNQRTRWIAAQIRYGMKSFGNALLHLLTRGNVDYFDKSLQFLLPPRLILLGLLFILTAITGIFQVTGWIWFVGLLLGYCIALFVAIPVKFLNINTLKATMKLPKTFWLMIVAITGYKKAKNNFLHTPKTLQS